MAATPRRNRWLVRSWPPALVLLLALGFFRGATIGCSEGETEGPPTPLPPILGPGHLGYKSQHCELCHVLPMPGHTATIPAQCAACHGGNGACNPNGPASTQQHAATDACSSCHASQHDFDETTDCASCHFAATGTDDCPPGAGGSGGGGGGGGEGGGGPVLRPSSELTSNCFDWPAQEFSPSSRALLTTGLDAGETAIDFTLQDVDGASYSLSSLLATKPVLLVFGAFT